MLHCPRYTVYVRVLHWPSYDHVHCSITYLGSYRFTDHTIGVLKLMLVFNKQVATIGRSWFGDSWGPFYVECERSL